MAADRHAEPDSAEISSSRLTAWAMPGAPWIVERLLAVLVRMTSPSVVPTMTRHVDPSSGGRPARAPESPGRHRRRGHEARSPAPTDPHDLEVTVLSLNRTRIAIGRRLHHVIESPSLRPWNRTARCRSGSCRWSAPTWMHDAAHRPATCCRAGRSGDFRLTFTVDGSTTSTCRCRCKTTWPERWNPARTAGQRELHHRGVERLAVMDFTPGGS